MDQSYSILTGVPVAALTLPLTPVFPFKQLKGSFENIYYVISFSSLKPASIFLLEHFPKCLTWLSRHYRIWLLALFTTSYVTFSCIIILAVPYTHQTYSQFMASVPADSSAWKTLLRCVPFIVPLHSGVCSGFLSTPENSTIYHPYLISVLFFSVVLSLISGCILICLILLILPFCGPMGHGLIYCVHSTIWSIKICTVVC